MKKVKNIIEQVLNAAGLDRSRRKKAKNSVVALKPPPDKIFSDQFKRYHLGCGVMIAESFLNIDGFDGEKEGLFSIAGNPQSKIDTGIPYQLENGQSKFVLRYDLREGIPAANNSLEQIYHSHFLEHLKDDEGRAFLVECFRCLKPNGIMRIALPDFNLWTTNYIQNNRKFFDWYRKAYLGDNANRYKTNASVFMGMLYNWGHKMSYDFETLSLLLSDIGFKDVIQYKWGRSNNISSIEELEGPSSERQLESFIVECSK